MQTPYNRIVKTNGEVHFELVDHDIATMAAMIRTLPEELQLPRDLTSEEDESIQFHHMQPGFPRFIFSGSPAAEPIFSHMLISPDMLRGSTTLDRLREIRYRLLRKTAHSGGGGGSAWEDHIRSLRGAHCNAKRGGHYTVGVTQESGHHRLQPAAATVMSPEYAKENAELVRLIGKVAGDVCRRFLPIATCSRLTERYHADVSIGLGHHDNMFVSTVQINITPHDEGLSALGDFSGLHVDHDDDPTRYTVLLGLSHMPMDYWPGRFVLAALREYCVLEPFAVLIFPGVQPHKGLAPALRDPPASPSSAVSTSAMDAERYIHSRLNIVAYPKRYMTEEAPIRLKVDYDGFQLHYKGLASFGTLRNLHEFFARRDMWLSVRAARHTMNPSVIIPTGEDIARCHRWLEDGVEMMPRAWVIEEVRRCMEEGDEDEWRKYQQQCQANLALPMFPGHLKTATVVWARDWRDTPVLSSNRTKDNGSNHTKGNGTNGAKDDGDDDPRQPRETALSRDGRKQKEGSDADGGTRRRTSRTKSGRPFTKDLERGVREVTDVDRLAQLLVNAAGAEEHDIIGDNNTIRRNWDTLVSSRRSADLMAGFIAASNIAAINHSQLNGLFFYAASYLQWQCNMSAFELTVEDSKMMDLFLSGSGDLGTPDSLWLRQQAREFVKHAHSCCEPGHFTEFHREYASASAIPSCSFRLSCRGKVRSPKESQVVSWLMRHMFLEPYAQKYLVRPARYDVDANRHGWRILEGLVRLLRRLTALLGGDSFFFLPGFHGFSSRFRGLKAYLSQSEEDTIVITLLREIRNPEVFSRMVRVHEAIFQRFLP